MDFSFPKKDEISTAYQQGEVGVLELFDQIEDTIITLSKPYKSKQKLLKNYKPNYPKTVAIVASHPPVMV